MALKKPYSTIRLILHSFEPSTASVIACISLAVCVILVHVFVLSLHYGTPLPSVLNGQLSVYYTSHVIRPFETILNAGTLNKILFVLLWGVLGLLVYWPCSYIIYVVRGLRHTEGVNAIQRKSFHKEFEIHVLWRFSLSIIAAILFLAARPVFHYVLSIDVRLFTETGVTSGEILRLGIAVIIWSCILHVGLILLRLYLFRTRVFGELLY